MPFFSSTSSDVYLTSVCLIISKDQLVLGRSDGSLIIASAMSAIECSIFPNLPKDQIFIAKDGHFDAITCIFYPASIASERYDR